ncbi:unnamed protein product [Protopolystoma xenopodis]|uniref:Uncharacterized protein n=1 Tax=Protopolystoma xenopodis TaxID=117903 RepID=A0A448X9A1_9PLAT|nr:unnamed protein product [Protopolystoma xenopodis]
MEITKLAHPTAVTPIPGSGEAITETSVAQDNGIITGVVPEAPTEPALAELAAPSQPIISLPIVSVSGAHGGKRKRRLVIDEQKSIPSEVMKIQMQDTSDITTQLDLAPPTKKLMFWKETGSVDKLFSLPGKAIPSRILQRLFTRNLITLTIPDDSPDEQQSYLCVNLQASFINRTTNARIQKLKQMPAEQPQNSDYDQNLMPPPPTPRPVPENQQPHVLSDISEQTERTSSLQTESKDIG